MDNQTRKALKRLVEDLRGNSFLSFKIATLSSTAIRNAIADEIQARFMLLDSDDVQSVATTQSKKWMRLSR